MSCQRVREALLEGEWAQRHLRECAPCRRFADALAAVERGLEREPQTPRAPAGVLPAVRVAVERERARQAQRMLLAGALAAAGLVVVTGVAALPLLTAVSAGWSSVVVSAAAGLEGLVGDPSATSSTLPAMAVLCALAGAALVRLLAAEG